jgi:hypothetical protein
VTPKVFWPGVAVGWSLIAVGVIGVAGEGRDVPVAAFGRWVVGLALVHDLVVAPLVVVLGFGLARGLRAPWRAIVGATLIVTGPIVLFAWPYVEGWGRSSANPSIQPRDYGRGLAVLLASIAATGAAVAVGAAVGRARGR